jgi:hypothetical protein
MIGSDEIQSQKNKIMKKIKVISKVNRNRRKSKKIQLAYNIPNKIKTY